MLRTTHLFDLPTTPRALALQEGEGRLDQRVESLELARMERILGTKTVCCVDGVNPEFSLE